MYRKFFDVITILAILISSRFLIAESNSDQNENAKISYESENQSILSLKYSILHPNNFISDNYLVMKTEPKDKKKESASYKSPGLSFGLSLLFPGLGQLYNGEYLKAILFPTGYIIGVAMIIASNPGADFDGQNPSPLLYVGIGIAGGSYLWNLIDAPVSANRINRENNLSGLKIISFEDEKYVLKFKSGFYMGSSALQFSFNF